MALLRVAQGRTAAALSGLERALGGDDHPAARPRILAARVEIALAMDDLTTARSATDTLVGLAEEPSPPYLMALVAHCRGAMELAGGDPHAAISLLRSASRLWLQTDTPYEMARTRVLLGAACRALGDDDAARMEMNSARATFEQLGARVDLDRLTEPTAPSRDHPLTPRETEVLRLLATGATNRAIADTLVLSEKTIARHVSNIFGKLSVSTRAGATAYAYEHGVTTVGRSDDAGHSPLT